MSTNAYQIVVEKQVCINVINRLDPRMTAICDIDEYYYNNEERGYDGGDCLP